MLKVQLNSIGAASRLATLLLARTLAVFAFVVPCQPGISTPQEGNLFLRGPETGQRPGKWAVLFRQHSPQVQHHTVVFDPGDDWRTKSA